MQNENPLLNALLYEFGSSIGLDQHRVEAGPAEGGEVATMLSIDVEGHLVDGRFYLCDVSRLLPPVFHPKRSSSIFYELFRAEALARLGVRLSSDALSRFVSKGSAESAELAAAQEAAVEAATARLFSELIPQACQHLSALMSDDEHVDSFDLTTECHRYGINMRYLGRVYAVLKLPGSASPPALVHWVAAEAMARALKKLLREKMAVLDSYSDTLMAVASMLDDFFGPLVPGGELSSLSRLADELQGFFSFAPVDASGCVNLLTAVTPLSVCRFRDTQPTKHSVRSFLLERLAFLCGVEVEKNTLEAIRLGTRGFDDRLGEELRCGGYFKRFLSVFFCLCGGCSQHQCV